MIHVRQDFRMNDDSRAAYLTLLIYSEAHHTRIAAIPWQKIPASSITTVLSIPVDFCQVRPGNPLPGRRIVSPKSMPRSR
jgi:hypothetical protein